MNDFLPRQEVVSVSQRLVLLEDLSPPPLLRRAESADTPFSTSSNAVRDKGIPIPGFEDSVEVQLIIFPVLFYIVQITQLMTACVHIFCT